MDLLLLSRSLTAAFFSCKAKDDLKGKFYYGRFVVRELVRSERFQKKRKLMAGFLVACSSYTTPICQAESGEF